MAPYPPIREPSKACPTSGGNDNQVMSMDKESPIKTLTVYKTIRGEWDDVFDVDPRDDAIDKSPKPIDELVKL